VIPSRSSKTAEAAAAVRAVEALRAEGQRLLNDQLAHYFLTTLHWRALYQAPAIARIILDSYDRRFPGMVSWIILRARHFEDILSHQIEQGLTQVVLVGAGYDTTAVRLQAPIRFFEVDHPSTQTKKIEVYRSLDLPASNASTDVIFVPCDLRTDDMVQRLRAAGFDQQKRSMFVWLAVSMFLEPEAVQETIATIAKLASSGSLLVHDYLIEDADSYPGGARTRKWAAAHGEPYLSQFRLHEIETIENNLGWKITENNRIEELVKRYGSKSPATKRVNEWIALIVAERVGGSDAFVTG
jgi:methyltransferase (TIGR00027 family)